MEGRAGAYGKRCRINQWALGRSSFFGRRGVASSSTFRLSSHGKKARSALTRRVAAHRDVAPVPAKVRHHIVRPLQRHPLVPEPVVARRWRPPFPLSLPCQLLAGQEPEHVEPVRGAHDDTLAGRFGEQCARVHGVVRGAELQPSAVFGARLSRVLLHASAWLGGDLRMKKRTGQPGVVQPRAAYRSWMRVRS